MFFTQFFLGPNARSLVEQVRIDLKVKKTNKPSLTFQMLPNHYPTILQNTKESKKRPAGLDQGRFHVVQHHVLSCGQGEPVTPIRHLTRAQNHCKAWSIDQDIDFLWSNKFHHRSGLENMGVCPQLWYSFVARNFTKDWVGETHFRPGQKFKPPACLQSILYA